MNSKGGFIMKLHNNSHNGPVINAAKRALDTGNAHYILIWIPEESGEHSEKSSGKSTL